MSTDERGQLKFVDDLKDVIHNDLRSEESSQFERAKVAGGLLFVATSSVCLVYPICLMALCFRISKGMGIYRGEAPLAATSQYVNMGHVVQCRL